MPEESLCRILLHTIALWVPAMLASGAFISSMLFSFWCESIKFEPVERNSTLAVLDVLHFGPWYQLETYVDYDEVGDYTRVMTIKECVDWKFDPEIDSKWKAVRAFTVMTAIIGGFATLALWFIPCVRGRINDSLWKGTSLLFCVVLTLFQGLTFLIFRSNACDTNSMLQGVKAVAGTFLYEDECQWDSGSSANVVSTVMWFCAGLVMIITGPPMASDVGPITVEAVTYQQEKAEDGTVKVAETQVVEAGDGTAAVVKSNVVEVEDGAASAVETKVVEGAAVVAE
mmetsp:Transcript_14060/g.18336  ORF Transcript_14060/g.18336 Transcript_14060/m.18336 type:complete len:285 (-) Transcript_14060:196-1050(-)|eukprot:CAMPEP_0198145332 /NCGR_PEP_ID=MMETSP1443-20131203/22748_1 /TAXON_ID=186043 /ORGANISM="Entomoneis sp., Strain CCMP2396" /LENGTH=284 /DNA_ID=CAMNT_0043808941 /DNA_START=61 /DNA_END=915 /DNA_ORIENTATION=+